VGGAVALHLNNVPAHTIQIMGRWSSDTFMTYIHSQLSSFALNLSTLHVQPTAILQCGHSAVHHWPCGILKKLRVLTPHHTQQHLHCSSGLGSPHFFRSTSLFFFLMGHTLTTTVSALMGTAARVDNDYPRSSKGTGLECVVRHYLMSLCR
jgi:hypothetical protein